MLNNQSCYINSGIYKIQNSINGKVYIGSTRNFKQRFKTHIRKLVRGCHNSKKLQNSWNKHGEANFTFDVIIVCAREHLLMYEQICIDGYDAVNNGYNVCVIAGARSAPHSDETKIKMSVTRKGRKYSQAHRDSISKGNKGKIRSAEARMKMSAARSGRPMHPKTMEALILSNKGRKMSDEQKNILKKARANYKISDETRARMSESAKKRHLTNPVIFTETIRKNMSAAAKVRANTPEFIEVAKKNLMKVSHRNNGKPIIKNEK